MNRLDFYKLYAGKIAFVIPVVLFTMSICYNIQGELFKIDILLIVFMFYYQFKMSMALREYNKYIKENNNG